MKSGQEVAVFSAEDGRGVVLRTPRWEDLDQLLGLINSLVDERAQIVVNRKLSRDEEADWLAGVLARLEKDKVFHLVAEVGGEVVASSDLHFGSGSDSHVGVVGIVVKKGFRDVGVGTGIMEAVVDVARQRGLRVLVLSAFSSNRRAIHVYEKLGFVECGRVPQRHFWDGRYVDEVVMARVLV